MPISQPSPDRLIFQPKYKSIISFQIVYGMLISLCLLCGGGSLFVLAYIFSAILSKTLRASYLNIFNNESELLGIIPVVILPTLFSIFFFYLTWLLFNHRPGIVVCTVASREFLTQLLWQVVQDERDIDIGSFRQRQAHMGLPLLRESLHESLLLP